MHSETTERGFRQIRHEKHQNMPVVQPILVLESSAIGEYEDSFQNPGSSYLWVGRDHHLDREQVGELISALQYWLENKRLPLIKTSFDSVPY